MKNANDTCIGCLTAPKTLSLDVSRTRLGFPKRASINLQCKQTLQSNVIK